MSHHSPADTLAGIEAALRLAERLTPSWTDPHRFHEAKSELIASLRAMAAQPILVRTVTRFVRVEVPAPAQPPPGPTGLPATRRRRRHRFPLPPPTTGSERLL